MQVVGRGRARLVGVLQALLRQPGGGALQPLERLGHRLDELLAARRRRRLGGEELLHRMEEAAQVAAHVRRQLAADEIERLDAVGALVDLGDAAVAHQLLDAVVAQ